MAEHPVMALAQKRLDARRKREAAAAVAAAGQCSMAEGAAGGEGAKKENGHGHCHGPAEGKVRGEG